MKTTLSKIKDLVRVANQSEDLIKGEKDEMVGLFKGPSRRLWFVNHYSLHLLAQSDLEVPDYLFVDGGLLAWQFGLFGHKIRRRSFDLTSVALDLFRCALQDGGKVLVIGGSSEEILKFIRIMEFKLGGIEGRILGVDGYSGSIESDVLELLKDERIRMVVAGLGSPKQEVFIESISKNMQDIARIYTTCGGFISQTANSGDGTFYPALIDKLNLRWLWRCLKQPYVVRRIAKVYPKSIFYVTMTKLLEK